MNPVVLYTTRFCPYCIRAKALLGKKQVPFTEIAIDNDPAMRQKMIQAAGRTSVPQIWIGEQHIGGCDELLALERRGQLDSILAGSGEGVGHE
ncbi:MAG: glutaredoxin 3 [Pseudomonadales bacterium]|nr:glutaredoxin 3 [Pseudomonadales bacterium]MDP4639820.1 glutaredoxin 3 [Pseudomonadales bacterium]MDP4765001.1 glutaredoxin 3 [Pseudomonadales bacterium]MDP4875648.1 glutaredoxin 3 [Pseudomonadales bacterium]MDP4910384.1 glutaredoxin 3 [Pseudomonadales bacterium]